LDNILSAANEKLMNDKGKISHQQAPGNALLAYRKFYIGEKLRFAKWSKREFPFWIPEDYIKRLLM
jgi:hypothetical protein